MTPEHHPWAWLGWDAGILWHSPVEVWEHWMLTLALWPRRTNQHGYNEPWCWQGDGTGWEDPTMMDRHRMDPCVQAHPALAPSPPRASISPELRYCSCMERMNLPPGHYDQHVAKVGLLALPAASRRTALGTAGLSKEKEKQIGKPA